MCAAKLSLRSGVIWLLLYVVNAVQAAEQRPNVVVFFADDLGYGELGCQGNAEIPTPHIDSIAENGIRFTNGYVTASYCSASRAGFLTGRHSLGTDIGETRNLAATHQEKQQQLKQIWERVNAEMIDPAWSPRRR